MVDLKALPSSSLQPLLMLPRHKLIQTVQHLTEDKCRANFLMHNLAEELTNQANLTLYSAVISASTLKNRQLKISLPKQALLPTYALP